MVQRPSTGQGSGGSPQGRAAETVRCTVCGHAVVAITIIVDRSPLEMSACANCDTRSWNLAGAPVDLAQVLAQVGCAAGRRR